jgi:drug/metabolite transporter (DMT)-like permease
VNRPLRGALLCAVGMGSLGASVPVTVLLLNFPAVCGLAVRFGAGGIILTLATVASRRSTTVAVPRTREWLLLATIAATGYVGSNLCLWWSLRHADPTAAATVVGCAPIVTAVAAPLSRRQLPSGRLLLAAAVIAAGTAAVYGGGAATPLGLLLAAGSLAGDVVASALAGRLSRRLGATRVTAYSTSMAALMLVGFAATTGDLDRWRMPTGSETTALLALVAAVLTLAAWFRGWHLLGPERAAMWFGLLPVAAVGALVAQQGVVPTPAQLTGTAAVAAGLTFGLGRWTYQPARTAAPVRLQVLQPALAGPQVVRHRRRRWW